MHLGRKSKPRDHRRVRLGFAALAASIFFEAAEAAQSENCLIASLNFPISAGKASLKYLTNSFSSTLPDLSKHQGQDHVSNSVEIHVNDRDLSPVPNIGCRL